MLSEKKLVRWMETGMEFLRGCLQAWLCKCGLVGTAASSAGEYVRRCSARMAPGQERFLAFAPVFLLYMLLPFVFDRQAELISRASTAAMLLWLANFKAMLLALNRGPLVDETLTSQQFLALLLWPVLHKEVRDSRHVGRLPPDLSPQQVRQLAWQRLIWRLPENLIISIIGGYTLTHPRVPIFLKTYSAAFGVCCLCGLFANAAAALVMWLHGLDVAPSWDRPWLQNCLSDFWSRRWNLPAAYTLRSLVFEPIVEGRAVRKVDWVDQEPAVVQKPEKAAGGLQDTYMNSVDRSPAGPDGQATQSEYVDVAAVKDRSGCTQFKATVTQVEGRDAQTMHEATASATAPTMDKAIATAEDKAEHALHDTPDTSALRQRKAPAIPTPATPPSSTQSSAHGKTVNTQHQDLASGEAAKDVTTPRKARVSAGRRLLALAATFAVSGVMHEILILVCCGWSAARPGLGQQMVYFLMQVPTSIIEQAMAKSFKKAKFTPPDVIAIPFTSLSLQIPGLFLFWNPIFNAATAAMQQP